MYQNFIPYEQDEGLNAIQLSEKLNYPYEYHEFYSESGHLISFIRIQKKNQGKIIDPFKSDTAQNMTNSQKKTTLKPVIFLHGLFCDMNTFFSSTEDQISPYMLANEGYDVWVANMRGNSMTQKHKKYQIYEKEFWDFSLDEFANEDFPQLTKIVGEFTNQKIDLVTLSLGGSITLLSLSAQNKEIEKYIDRAVLLAPGAGSWNVWMFDMMRFFKLPTIAKKLNIFAYYYNTLGYHFHHFFPFISQFFMSLALEGSGSFNYQRGGYTLATFPSSTSIKLLEHLVQMNESKKITKFDYGKEENIKRYGQETPIEYQTQNIRAGKIFIFYGEQDILVPNEDMFWLKKNSPNADMTLFGFENQGHCSFINSTEKTYYDMIKEILVNNNYQPSVQYVNIKNPEDIL